MKGRIKDIEFRLKKMKEKFEKTYNEINERLNKLKELTEEEKE